MNVSDLIAMVGAETSLNVDSGNAERIQVLSALNRSYRKIARDFQCVKGKLDIANSGAVTLKVSDHVPTSYPGTDAGNDVLGVDFVGVSDTGDTYPDIFLERRPIHQLLAAQSGADGKPTVYAMQNGIIHLNSASSSGETIHVWAFLNPTALVDGSAETDIQGIPPSYHEDLLGTLATAYLLEGYEGQEQRASYYRNLYKESAEDFRQHLRREGGTEMPSTRPGAPHFHSRSPLNIR
jgi:hypothetical protein